MYWCDGVMGSRELRLCKSTNRQEQSRRVSASRRTSLKHTASSLVTPSNVLRLSARPCDAYASSSGFDSRDTDARTAVASL